MNSKNPISNNVSLINKFTSKRRSLPDEPQNQIDELRKSSENQGENELKYIIEKAMSSTI